MYKFLEFLLYYLFFFFFNDTATTEIYTLSLHDALPISAAYCRERGLQWREDPTNESLDFARNRVRHQLLPALRSLHPAAETNVLRTLAILRDEAAVLDELIAHIEPDL